jgi:hypothetical protein
MASIKLSIGLCEFFGNVEKVTQSIANAADAHRNEKDNNIQHLIHRHIHTEELHRFSSKGNINKTINC